MKLRNCQSDAFLRASCFSLRIVMSQIVLDQTGGMQLQNALSIDDNVHVLKDHFLAL